MCEARERSEWARMSSLLSLTANVHRDKKKAPPFTPDDWNPYKANTKGERIESDISALKAVFIDRKAPKELRTKAQKGNHE